MPDETLGANTGNINISDISGGQIEVGAIVTGTVGGDVVGRDKIVNNINNITKRTLTAAEEADIAQNIAQKRLAEGVRAYVQRIGDIATDDQDALQGGPYRGLKAYTLREAEIFFGREEAMVALLSNIQRGQLTILHAESGAGKSSLLQAGIQYQLIIQGHVPLYVRPYDKSPVLAIKQAFLPSLESLPELANASLRDYLHQVANIFGVQTILVILIDQFEELFFNLNEEARQRFVDDLAACLEDEALNVRWVLALRTEFFGNLANFRPRIKNPFENDLRLNRLPREQAETVITEPAKLVGVTFEPELIEVLLDDLSDPDSGEVIPAQIQLVCLALYNLLQQRQQQNPDLPPIITLTIYNQEGRAEGILRGYLQRVLRHELKAEDRESARQLLIALVSSDQRRVRRTKSELAAILSTYLTAAQNLDGILDQLVDSRLLNIDEDEKTSELSYELAHDLLVNQIEIDPETQAQKAAQHMLDQEVETYKQFETLLSKDKFDIINSQRDVLVLDETAQELLRKSEDIFEQEFREKEAQRQRELEQAQQLKEEAEARQKAEAQRAQEAEAREREQAESNKRLKRLSLWVVMILGFTACSSCGSLLNLLGTVRNDYPMSDFLAVDTVFFTILPGLIGAGLGWFGFRFWLSGRLGNEGTLSSEAPTVEQEAMGQETPKQRPVKLRKRVDKSGWLEFANLPDTHNDKALRQHLETLSGAEVTLFVPEFVTEATISFQYKGYKFSVDNGRYQWEFHVTDASCPEDILQEVADHCAGLLGAPNNGERNNHE